jgi:hypothetical protein
MKKWMFISILCIWGSVLGQGKCSAFIDWTYSGSVLIYDKPDGIIVCEMKNDQANEDILILDMLDQTDDYFYVSITLAINKDYYKGWIRKSAYIGVYLRNTKTPIDLILYKDKKQSSSNNIFIKDCNKI